MRVAMCGDFYTRCGMLKYSIRRLDPGIAMQPWDNEADAKVGEEGRSESQHQQPARPFAAQTAQTAHMQVDRIDEPGD